jgi:putative salt-induced outer membrane protein YdiY
MKRSLWMLVGATLLVALLGTSVAVAQEEEEGEAKKWSNKTEFGLTTTSGNAETTNLSLGNVYKREWTKAEFTFDLMAIKNESTVNFYTGLPGNEVLEERTETSAETYTIGLVYRRTITGRLFWYANGRWFRNVPAGLLDRYRGGAGIGYTFFESKKHKFLGEIGATYTDDTKSVENPPSNEASFTYTSATVLFGYDFKISDTAELTSIVNGFFDVDESENWQANWVTSLTASLSSRLALKLTYTVVYDNLPADIPVAPGPGTLPGAGPIPFEAENTDTFLTASLVLNF